MPKIDIGIVTTISARTVVDPVGEFGRTFSTSAAQSAITRWKNGSHRKLHRKTPTVGIIASKSTTKSKTSSHFIRLISMRGRQMNPAINAAGAASPHANSVAVCGTYRAEKSAQLTVQHGRMSPGNARHGTIHCQCASAG